MLMWVKAGSVIGSLLVIIALVIALLKALIGLVGFVAFALKALIVLAFIGVFACVGYIVFRSWQESRRNKA